LRAILLIYERILTPTQLELLLGVHVDLLTPGDLPQKFRAKVLAEAQPV
jgi:predicted nucleotidyltransferase